MKTILFPTDFSKNAHHASQYAGMLARYLKGKIILLNIFNTPILNDYQSTTDLEELIKKTREDAEENLRAFTCDFIGYSNLSPDRITQIVEYGFTSEKIVEIAKMRGVDFIMMGTKGASNIIDRVLGTHAEEVMKTALCPVWIIPDNAEINCPTKIVYAADFKVGEKAAIKNLVKIAKPFGAKTKVIHIHDYFGLSAEAKTQERLQELKEEFIEEDDVFIKKINRDDVIEGLEAYLDLYKPNLLALAIQDKSLLSKIFETSVSRHFIHNSSIPMLTFRK